VLQISVVANRLGVSKMPEYKQPKAGESVNDKDMGYPVTDINKNGIMSMGRWMNNPGTKSFKKARGSGAATKGNKFLDN
jgi:hypothetical protein